LKRRIVFLLVSMTTVLGIAAMNAPTAAATKGGSCTDSYSLVRASRYGDPGLAADKNGNGWLCEKPIPANPPGSFNVIDDHA
jgi:hypothetical protein